MFGINFRERTYVFGCRVGLVFSDDVSPRFLLYNLTLAPEMSGKNSLDVRSSFLGSFNTATVLSHLRGCCSPFSKGEMLSVFFSMASSASFAFFGCFSLLGLLLGVTFRE